MTGAGYRPLETDGPRAALMALGRDRTVALVLTDIRMPSKEEGIRFIRGVRLGWPDLPLVAVTAYPEDLTELHGTSECPLLILPKPLRPQQIEEILRLVLRSPGTRSPVAGGAR